MRLSTLEHHCRIANRVIDHIDANLHRQLALDEIAASVCLSQRQLLRVMRRVLDESQSAYIARLRLERAVLYLRTEECSLAELAERVGYDNPQSLSKAFRRQFGISPKAYMRRLKERLVHDCDEPEESWPAEVCDVPPVELVYLRIVGRYGDPGLYRDAWSRLTAFAKERGLLTEATRWIGLSFDDPNITRAACCRFYACISVDRPVAASGAFGTFRLPGGRHAVFALRGDYAQLGDLYKYIGLRMPYPLRYGSGFEECVVHSDEEPHRNLTKVYVPVK